MNNWVSKKKCVHSTGIVDNLVNFCIIKSLLNFDIFDIEVCQIEKWKEGEGCHGYEVLTEGNVSGMCEAAGRSLELGINNNSMLKL